MINLIFNKVISVTPLSLALYLFIISISAASLSQTNHSNSTKTFDEVKKYLYAGDRLNKLFPDSAVFYYQNGLTVISALSQSEKSDSAEIFKVILLSKIGNVFHMQSKYSFATDYYRRALIAAKEVKDDSLLAECNFNLGEIYLENGSYNDAVTSYKNAMGFYKKIKSDDGIFWSDIGLGIVYREMGNTALSKAHYEKALEIGEDNNNDYYIGTCNNNIGNLYSQTGNYESAIKYLQRSLNSFEKLGNKKLISDCLEGMGNVYAEYGDYNRAIEYFKRSTKLAESLHDNYRLLARYANLAKAYSFTNEDEQAFMYFSKTLELAQSIGDKSRMSEILVVFSDFYKKKNDYERAISTLKMSLSISEEIGDTVSIALAFSAMSGVYYSIGDMNNALSYANDAFIIAERKNLLKILQESLFYLSKIYEHNKNYKEAYKFFQKYTLVKDSLMNSDKIRILEETESRFNLEHVEKEKLEIENEALQSAKRVQERNILIAVLGFSLLVFSIFFGRYFKKKRAEKKASDRRSLQLTKKIDLLSSQLNAKNRELASKAIMISKNNKILQEISEDIDECLNTDNTKRELGKLKNRLSNTYQEENWDDFLKHFNEVHPGFYKDLSDKYPDLSSMEQKICAFLKMNLNTKEIAQINSHSVKSIEVARTRIRKKMGIKRTESLTNAIQSI
jgi:tetratricopeptide (TPR) repeat protein